MKRRELLIYLCCAIAAGVIWYVHSKSVNIEEEIAALDKDIETLTLKQCKYLESDWTDQQFEAVMGGYAARLERLKGLRDLTDAEAGRLKVLGTSLIGLRVRASEAMQMALADVNWRVRDPDSLGPIPLRKYAKFKTGSADVQTLGFAEDAAERIFLFRRRDEMRNRPVVFVSGDKAHFEDYGGTTYGFILPEPLAAEFSFRPGSAEHRQSAIDGLKGIRQKLPGLEQITIYAAPGVVSCDRFVAEFSEICEKAGLRVVMRSAPEGGVYSVEARTSRFHIQCSSAIFAERKQIAAALGSVVKISERDFERPRRHMRVDGMEITIVGFPRFDAEGVAGFDEDQ